MGARRVLILALLAVLAAARTAAAPPDTDRAALLQGVSQIASPGIPGPVLVSGPGAFAVVAGKVGKDLYEPVVAGARWGRGRVVAFGHPGYFGGEALAAADTGRLMANAAAWCAGGRAAPRIAVWRAAELAAYLRGRGLRVSEANGADRARRLAEADVVCCSPSDLTDADRAALGRWVRGGGGLIAAELGWGWLQLNPGRDLTQHGGNRLLREAGLQWADGYFDRTSPVGYAAAPAPPALCHARAALDAVAGQGAARPLDRAAATQAVWTVSMALRTLPADDRTLLPRLRALAAKRRAGLASAWEKPITLDDPLMRLVATLDLQEAGRQPAEKVRRHPWAAAFPGDVPANAPRVTRTVEVDTGVTAWHSTGLYAAPGEVLHVDVPAEAVGRGLSVRIGCHTDTLWDQAKWERAPDITRTFPLRGPTTPAACAFGGPVYIDVPGGCNLGRVRLTIRGAVEAPHYVRGQTDPAAWRDTIRRRPGPWAELEGRRVVLSVPSSAVRELDDPEPVLAFWDAVVDACADLAAMPRERPYPERYVADRQISAGYMHSGYPIMTWLDVVPLVVDRDRLMREGSWGHFHEMGHNHQSGDWTFEGTGEVTENLFSMFVTERVLGQPFDQGHPAIRDRAKRLERVRQYLAGGARFEEWKADPFLALTMYIQLIDGFGWDFVRKVFAEYRALPAGERPRTDDEKRDQWLVRVSRCVGRDLGPFFQAWGVPTSEAARQSIRGLPAWMPADWPR